MPSSLFTGKLNISVAV